MQSCKKHSPDNFTLITSGYSGVYPGLTTGLDRGRAREIVAARWGINFDWRGCVVSNDTQWQDFKNNWEAENNIEDKYGNDWMRKFNKEVEAEYKLEQYKEKTHPILNSNLVQNLYPSINYKNLSLSFKFINDTLKSKFIKVQVFNRDKLYQEIEVNKVVPYRDCDLIDWTFDGYKDITVLNKAGSYGSSYLIWNYEPKSRKFVYNKILSERIGIMADTHNKLIVINKREIWPKETRNYYRYTPQKLVWEKGVYKK